jgi:hypothetical protein
VCLGAPLYKFQRLDLAVFKDASTRAVVLPWSVASGALIYPYTKAKRNA